MNRPSAIIEAARILETSVHPRNHLAFLSQDETNRLINHTDEGLYPLIRNCALAVLNGGVATDDSLGLFAQYPEFTIEFERHPRGLKVILKNAPAQAFVDGVLIETIHDHLFAVLRDLLHSRDLCQNVSELGPVECSNLVFQILRNAKVLESNRELSCVVCWGGRSVNQVEYDYTQAVGQELGLRRFDICTGCGPGAMKGPMRGALYAHRRQNYTEGRFIGISEPGIIAAEPPNGVVSDLVIMPDIEKRLEAFVRIAHGIIIFPGGAGTFEEILYLLAILSSPSNARDPIPIILTGPQASTGIIDAYRRFLNATLGRSLTQRLEVLIDDPVAVAERIQQGRDAVRSYRIETNDAYYFNWTLDIPEALQRAFIPTHQTMRELQLNTNQPPQVLACELRRLFSGIVAGNVKPETQALIQHHGPFEVHASPELGNALDELLQRLITEKRMKANGDYKHCYKIIPTY
jgi:predicted Rossmann-fold nucleotide-binding protein